MNNGKFYMIPDIDFLWTSEFEDPVAQYGGKEVNAYTLEEYLGDKFEAWWVLQGKQSKPAPNEYFDFVRSYPQITRDYILKHGHDI